MKKVVAQRGEHTFLVVDSENENMGQVLDLEQGVLFRPMYVESLIARGYWEDCKKTDKELAEMLKRVKEEPLNE